MSDRTKKKGEKKRPLSKKKAEELFWHAIDEQVLDADMLEQALASGHIDPNVEFDYLGDGEILYTPLEVLVMHPGEKSRRCMEVLIRHGADINRNEHGTVLQGAALFGDRKTIEMLFDHGAKIEEPGKVFRGYTELEHLLSGGAPLDLFHLIVERGKIVLPSPDSQEMFALFSSLSYARENKEAYLDFFLQELRVSIDLRDAETGQTLLIMAAENKNREMYDLLVARGADTQVRDKWGHNALFYLTLDERIDHLFRLARMRKIFRPQDRVTLEFSFKTFSEDMMFAHAIGESFEEALSRALQVAEDSPIRSVLAICEGASLLHGDAHSILREALKGKGKNGKRPHLEMIMHETDLDTPHAKVLLFIDPLTAS